MFQHTEIKLKRQQKVATASLTGTSTPWAALASAAPLLERLWQMGLLLGPGLLPGGVLCRSVASVSKPVTVWTALQTQGAPGRSPGKPAQACASAHFDFLAHPLEKMDSCMRVKVLKGTQQLIKLCCNLIIEKNSSSWWLPVVSHVQCYFWVRKSTPILDSARKRWFQMMSEIKINFCLKTMLHLDKY